MWMDLVGRRGVTTASGGLDGLGLTASGEAIWIEVARRREAIWAVRK